MKVKRISMQNFGVHEQIALDLPEAGVVIIHGKNGTGKSTFIEAISFALWGKTIRGTTMLGSSTVLVDSTIVRRNKTANKETFSVGDEIFDTKTKGKGTIEAQFGKAHNWQNRCVLTSSKVSLFMASTDGERKKIIDDILNISFFDQILSETRDILNPLKKERDRLEGQIAYIQGKAEENKHLSLLPEKEEQELILKRKELKEASVSIRRVISEHQAQTQILDQQMRKAKKRLEELSRQNEELSKDNRCYVCHSEIDKGKREELSLKVSEETREILRDLDRAQMEILRGQEAMAKAEDEEKKALRGLAKIDRDYPDLGKRLFSFSLSELNEKVLAVQELNGCIALHEHVLHIFGPKGVRHHLFRDVMHALSDRATYFMQFLHRGSKISLSFLEGTRIEINVTGFPTEEVEGLSSGQQRRVAIALTLAMCEIAEEFQGKGRGTLFLDEIFDTLDQDGRESVVELIEELAKDRAVILISQNDDMLAAITPVKRIQL